MFNGQDMCYFVETSLLIIKCILFSLRTSVISLDNIAATNIVCNIQQIVLSGKLITQ
jgi:hypothetical protein